MNTAIQKIILKLGPRFADKAPAIAAFLLMNPELIPVLLLCGGGIAAMLKAWGVLDE